MLKTIEDLRRLGPEMALALLKPINYTKDLTDAAKAKFDVKLPGYTKLPCEACEGKGVVAKWPRRTGVISPSSLGPDTCMRRVWYAVTEQLEGRENIDGRLHLIFQLGHLVHGLLQDLTKHHAYEHGYTFEDEVTARIEDLLLYGSADGIVETPNLRYVIELKTISSGGFTDLTKPKPEHIWQTTAYMAALDAPATVFVYFDKDTSTMRSFTQLFDEPLWLNTIRPKLESILEIGESGPEAISFGGKAVTDWKCKQCPFEHGCDKKPKGAPNWKGRRP